MNKLRRMGNLLQQDLANALRDSILLYMIIGPFLLAVGASLFLPSLDRVTATFAVQSGLDTAFIDRLGQYGTVEVYPSRAAVEERVLRMDDVTGIVPGAQGVELLLEGTEAEGPEGVQSVINAAMSGKPVAEYAWDQSAAGQSRLTEYGTMSLILIDVLLGAVIMAFIIIEDKETRAIRALGVSPLSMLEMTIARGLFAIILGYLLVVATSLIMVGGAIDYALLTLGFLFSVGLPVLVGYIIGGLADNQLKAIAILKFVMLIYLTLPILTAFLPRTMHPYFYILPNYWMWTVFENIFVGQVGPVGFWGASLITLIFSMLLIAVLMPRLRSQLKLR